MKILVSLLIIVLFMGCESKDEKRMRELNVQIQKEKREKINAILTSHNMIKKTLKAPTTAIFQDPFKAECIKTGADIYQIKSYVDSQNSFGAMLRTNYLVVLKYHEKNRNYSLEKIIIE